MSKTKIVVIQMKEIVYTAIFVGLGILLVLLLVVMFLPKKDSNTKQAQYTPGVYSNQITLGETSLNVEVVVDENHINDVSVTNLSDSITTMFPMVKPALEDLSKQLSNNVALDDIVYPEHCKYTEMLLIEGVENALKKAAA